MDKVVTYLLYGPTGHVPAIWTNQPCTCYMDQLTTYLFNRPTSHVPVVGTNKPRICYMHQPSKHLSYGPPSHVTVMWCTAIIFKPCKTYSFNGLFFFLIPRYNQAFVCSVYQSVAIWLCCILLHDLCSTIQLHLLRYLSHNTPSQVQKLFPRIQHVPHREHSPRLYLKHDNRDVTHTHKEYYAERDK